MAASADPAAWANAARLVRRSGFGATGAQIEQVLKVGPDRWIARALAASSAADPGVKATPMPTLAPLPKKVKGGSTADKKAHQKAVKDGTRAAITWWLRRMIAAQNPVPEKITFGWHGHFATSVQKVKDAGQMLAQNEKQRSLGRGSFTTLAMAMISDAAMLHWLDGQKNTKAAPNENLAREFMELFALGRTGGYTENDVKEAARALTGWVIAKDGSTRVVPARADTGVKTILGVTGPIDTTQFVSIVLAQPSSPRFVASRWWRLLAAPCEPPAPTLARLVAAYGSKRDLSALFRAIFTDPAFAAADGSLVASPVEWYVGAARALRTPTDDQTLTKAAATLRQLGQEPFLPPSVGGWPGGTAWLSTAAAVIRQRAAGQLVKTGNIAPVADAAPAARIDAVVHLIGLPRLSPRTRSALTSAGGNPEKLLTTALISPEYLVN